MTVWVLEVGQGAIHNSDSRSLMSRARFHFPRVKRSGVVRFQL